VRFSLWLLLTISVPALAKNVSCEVAQALSDPQLAKNEKFWHQLGELSNAGKYDDANIAKLLAEHGVKIAEPKLLTAAQEGAAFSGPSYTMNSKAMKDVEKLPGHLRDKFNQFLESIGTDSTASMESLRSQPGKWRLEKLEGYRDGWSVRLNHGYRVAFHKKDGVLEIFDVTKSATH
jgi:plasmid maintenance system killer protein